MILTTRFQRSRWSKTRRSIDAMRAGQTLRFSTGQYFNAKASVDRLNDAYDGARRWKLTRRNGRPIVREIETGGAE